MKTNEEILDDFGKEVINTVFDFNYVMLKSNINNNLKKGTLDNKKISFFSEETLRSVLFDFLKIFEENEEFKLYYEKDGQKVNLVEISEMLKAEPIIENGWIERFSKELKKEG
ncbi:hypothetical protein [Tenacibaculum sp. Ill]|uniref:hypothetical protein n=1 Tax=Tenacibaculum sp. Ill TaxID=3445935 RepID=UPI003F7A25A0